MSVCLCACTVIGLVYMERYCFDSLYNAGFNSTYR